MLNLLSTIVGEIARPGSVIPKSGLLPCVCVCVCSCETCFVYPLFLYDSVALSQLLEVLSRALACSGNVSESAPVESEPSRLLAISHGSLASLCNPALVFLLFSRVYCVFLQSLAEFGDLTGVWDLLVSTLVQAASLPQMASHPELLSSA